MTTKEAKVTDEQELEQPEISREESSTEQEPDYRAKYQELKQNVLNRHLDETLGEVAPNIPRSSIDAAIKQGMNPESAEIYAKVLQGHFDRGQSEFKAKTRAYITEIEQAAQAKAEAEVQDAWGSPVGGSSSGRDTSPLSLEQWVSQGADESQIHRLEDAKGGGR